MADDAGVTESCSPRTLQLISSLHLQGESDGGALVIDDRTLTAARVNKAAYILLDALRQPRAQEDLVAILADAANSGIDDVVASVAHLVDDLMDLGWVEVRSNAVGTGSGALPPTAASGSSLAPASS